MRRGELRAAAMERDDNRCAWPGCTETRWLEMAHIYPSAMGGRPAGDVIENVWMLCKSCHDHFDGRSPQRTREYRALAAAYVANLHGYLER
jgi:5-methylcytosine-specific restriction endonuclease McrA